jgi:hypothetical protein
MTSDFIMGGIRCIMGEIRCNYGRNSLQIMREIRCIMGGLG